MDRKLKDARQLVLIERFPHNWWWTFALDRCYPEYRRHTAKCKCLFRVGVAKV